MTEAPWRSEVDLSDSAVAELVARRLPALAPVSVRYLAEGWDSRAHVVNGSAVFRFPKRREVDGWLRAELRVLEYLRRLPVDVVVPRPEWIGEPAADFPFAFAGYPFLPGRIGLGLGPSDVDVAALSAGLGRFLAVLHGVPAADLAPLDLRDPDGPGDPLWDEARSLSADALPRLPPHLAERARETLSPGTRVPPPGGRPCLVHADLQAEHMLVDDRGGLSGVLDRGDPGLGDPAGDFAGLHAWLGPNAVLRALERHPFADDAFRERVAFRGRCLALVNVGWAARGRSPAPALYVEMAGRAFGP